MRMSCRAAHSSNASRLCRPISRPVGFWKLGTKDTDNPPVLADESGVDVVECREVDAVGFLWHTREPRLHVAKRGDRPCIGGQLDEDDVPGIEEHACDGIEPLL